MNTKKEPNLISEININTIKNISTYIEDFHQDNENYKVITNTQYANFTEIQSSIDSLLSLAIECCFNDTAKLNKLDMGNILEIAKTKLHELPIEFIDRLLVKKPHTSQEFKRLNEL